MNTKPTPSKLSTLDKLLNRALIVLMCGLFVLTVVSDALAIWWRGHFFYLPANVTNGSVTCGADAGTTCEPWYLFPLNQPFDQYLLPPWLAYFFTYAILYSNFVPIVLYVLVEILNTWLAALISEDHDMWDEASGESAMVRSTNLCQELGQIEYVFSDKTGTITKNRMFFNGWSVCVKSIDEATGDITFASRRTLNPKHDPDAEPAKAESPITSQSSSSSVTSHAAAAADDVIYAAVSERLAMLRESKTEADVAELERTRSLLVAMSVAHTVVIAPRDSDDAVSEPPDAGWDDLDDFLGRFQSASPDELCLVKAAARIGMIYRGTVHGCVVVEVANEDLWDDEQRQLAEGIEASSHGASTSKSESGVESKSEEALPKRRLFRVFKLLVTTKFNSTRKRMSVVVREMDGSSHHKVFPNNTLVGMDIGEASWGNPIVLCKGADNVILARSAAAQAAATDAGSRGHRAAGSTPVLRSVSFREVSADASTSAMATEEVRELNSDLDLFSRAGLRTLVFANRSLPETEWEAWEKRLSQCLTNNTVDGEKLPDVQAVHMRLGEELEGHFTLIGASAIEDELQDNVGPTIKSLRRADVKVWVLTGDKLETAISIGLSCEIIDQEMSLLELSHRSLGLDDSFASLAQLRESGKFVEVCEQVDQHLTQAVLKVNEVWPYLQSNKTIYRDPQLGELLKKAMAHVDADDRKKTADKSNQLVAGITTDKIDNVGMVVTGKLLDIIMTQPILKDKLLVIAVLCTSVVACRVSPLQKAELVRLVQRGLSRNPVTLAIGDGANDVTMIQQAQVGVGISGVEGLQAANASDFSIAQFQFLYTLMMKHGRWNYRRLSKVVLFFYYKNMLLPFTVFFYSMYTGFSGTTLYDSYTMQLYNIVFTTPPILAIGAFDTDVAFKVMRKFPELYQCGRISSDLNNRKMATQLVFSILHSLAIFGWPRLLLLAFNTGNNNSIQLIGACTFTNLVMTVNFRAFMLTHSWNAINTCFSVVTIVFLYIFLALYSLMWFLQPDFYWVGLRAMSQPVYWVSLVCCLLSVTVIDYGSELFRLQFYPSLMDLGRLLDRSARRKAATEAVDAQKNIEASSKGRRQSSHSHIELTSVVSSEFKKDPELQAASEADTDSDSAEDFDHDPQNAPCNGACVRDKKSKLLLAPLFQQTAPTWNPVATTASAPIFFLIAGVCFLILGIATYAAGSSVVTYKLEYSPRGPSNASIGGFAEGYDIKFRMPCEVGCACILQVPLLEDFPADEDLLFAFELSSEFHQNYFRYSRNRSFPQLQGFEDSTDDDWGDSESISDYFASCGVSPLVVLNQPSTPLDELGQENFTTYYPCGMIANSFFADSVEIVSPSSNATNGANASGRAVPVPTGAVELDLSSLEWPSDDFVFELPEWWNDTLTYAECVEAPGPAPSACIAGRPAHFRYIHEQPAVAASTYYAPRLFENGVTDPHLRTWMRSSGLGPAWKHFGTLVGGINALEEVTGSPLKDFELAPTGSGCQCSGVEAGPSDGYCIVQPAGLQNVPEGTKMLELAVVSSFEVDSYGASKTLVMTTVSTLGNLEEGIAKPCLVLGCLAIVVSVVWFAFQKAPCANNEGSCRFEALLSKRLTAKQQRTMQLQSVEDIAAAIR